MLSFSAALDALKNGDRVARSGWNGKGMWLAHVTFGPDKKEMLNHIADAADLDVALHNVEELLPWIGMKTADNKFVPWLASQTDILAEDWSIVA